MRRRGSGWPGWLLPIDEGEVLVHLQVVADSRHTRIMGADPQRLCLQVAGAASDGSADRLLVRFVAQALGVEVPQVAVVAGARRPRKTLRLSQVSPQRCLMALAPRQ